MAKLTTKERFWLDHLNADRISSSLKTYTTDNNLPYKKLYHWRSKLIRLGKFNESVSHSESGFIQIKRRGSPSVHKDLTCRITLPSGVAVELGGDVDARLISQILIGVTS